MLSKKQKMISPLISMEIKENTLRKSRNLLVPSASHRSKVGYRFPWMGSSLTEMARYRQLMGIS